MAYNEKVLVRISDSYPRLLLPPQSTNITQLHQTMWGCNICIQAVTYQESLNHWNKKYHDS